MTQNERWTEGDLALAKSILNEICNGVDHDCCVHGQRWYSVEVICELIKKIREERSST